MSGMSERSQAPSQTSFSLMTGLVASECLEYRNLAYSKKCSRKRELLKHTMNYRQVFMNVFGTKQHIRLNMI